ERWNAANRVVDAQAEPGARRRVAEVALGRCPAALPLPAEEVTPVGRLVLDHERRRAGSRRQPTSGSWLRRAALDEARGGAPVAADVIAGVAGLAVLDHAVAARAEIAGVADAVGVCVGLARIRDERAVVDGVGHTVPVGVRVADRNGAGHAGRTGRAVGGRP